MTPSRYGLIGSSKYSGHEFHAIFAIQVYNVLRVIQVPKVFNLLSRKSNTPCIYWSSFFLGLILNIYCRHKKRFEPENQVYGDTNCGHFGSILQDKRMRTKNIHKITGIFKKCQTHG